MMSSHVNHSWVDARNRPSIAAKERSWQPIQHGTIETVIVRPSQGRERCRAESEVCDAADHRDPHRGACKPGRDGHEPLEGHGVFLRARHRGDAALRCRPFTATRPQRNGG